MLIEKFDLNRMALTYINAGKDWLMANTDDETYRGKTTILQIEEDYAFYRVAQLSNRVELHEEVSKCSVVTSLGVPCLQIAYL